MKVLISGAGIGGLTLAAFLEECNISFDIVEKSPNWDRRGFSLGMWDNGRDMLAKLGLSDHFDSEGLMMKEYCVSDGAGKLLMRYNLKDFYVKYGSAYTHVDRGRLHQWLLDKVGPEKIRMNMSVSSLQDLGDRVEVVLSDGQSKSYDLVVGADGVHSGVRALAFGKNIERYIGYRAWFFRVSERFGKRGDVMQYREHDRIVSVFDDKSGRLCVAVAPADHAQWDEEATRVERMKSAFAVFPALFPGILEGVAAHDIIPTDIATVSVDPWHRGRAVLLGDAAHALEPFAGLGASMAMEDAYVLASELARITEHHPMERALNDFWRRRKERVMRARKATDGVRQGRLSKHRWLMKFGKYLIPYLPTAPFTRNFHKLLQEEI